MVPRSVALEDVRGGRAAEVGLVGVELSPEEGKIRVLLSLAATIGRISWMKGSLYPLFTRCLANSDRRLPK